jgi:transposase
MSLHIESTPEIPEETVRIARASFRKGNKLMTLRDEYGPLFRIEDFSDLYSWKGNEGINPVLLASVTVLQYLENLSDVGAAEQVRARIDWKYLLGVPLDYAGFTASDLSEFRARLLAHESAERLFEKPLAQMKALGMVKERGQQRTDSTHVLAAVRTLNRLELVGETLRHALNQLAVEGRGWLTSWVPNEWFERYGSRIEEGKLPQAARQRTALAQTIAQDGLRLLSALYDEKTPDFLKQLPALEVLRQVWLQQFQVVEGALCWREAGNVPPAEQMINSPYDAEVRFSRKRTTTWTGAKVHLSESYDPNLPHLLTHIETTAATEPDFQTLPKIHAALEQKGLLPAEHALDAGYVTIDNLLDSQAQLAVELIGPMRPDTSHQARAQQGFDVAHFVIDWHSQTVTCPQGKTSTVWSPSTDAAGRDSITVRFRKQDCSDCPVRSLCTQAKSAARALHLQATAHKQLTLQQARQNQLLPAFKERYNPRAGIEGSISLGVRSFELRTARFIGQAKLHLQHLATAAAINFARLALWFTDPKLAKTRTSSFAQLATAFQPIPVTQHTLLSP